MAKPFTVAGPWKVKANNDRANADYQRTNAGWNRMRTIAAEDPSDAELARRKKLAPKAPESAIEFVAEI